MTSNSYKSGSYAVLGNSPTMNAVLGREYFVRKAPTTANAVTTYIATAASASRAMGTTTFANAAYDCTPNPYNGPWSLWNTAAPIFQFVGTSNKSWQNRSISLIFFILNSKQNLVYLIYD